MAGYGTDEGFADWLTANGYTLPVGAPTPAVLRERGSNFIDAAYGDPLAPRSFKGEPTGGYAQVRSFPRTGMLVYKATVPSDIIPVAVEAASYHAAWLEASSPGSLSADMSQSGAVKREKIGELETEYFGAGDSARSMTTVTAPAFLAIDGLLSPYLQGSISTASIGLWSLGPSA